MKTQSRKGVQPSQGGNAGVPGGRLGTVKTQAERRNDNHNSNLPRKSRPTLKRAGDLERAAAPSCLADHTAVPLTL